MATRIYSQITLEEYFSIAEEVKKYPYETVILSSSFSCSPKSRGAHDIFLIPYKEQKHKCYPAILFYKEDLGAMMYLTNWREIIDNWDQTSDCTYLTFSENEQNIVSEEY